MKILLTGSRGYIGSVMAPFLVRAGHEVVGVDTDLYRRSSFGEWKDTIETRAKDVRSLETKDLDGFDAVIHLAALSNDPLGDLNPQITYDINHVASVRLARARASEAGVPRFLYSSSCSSYGAAGDDLVDETAELHPITAVCDLQGPRRARRREAGGRLLQPYLSPERDGLRRLATPALRPRPEQPRGLGVYQGQVSTSRAMEPPGDPSSTSRISRGAFLAVLTAPRAARSTARPSTWARPRRTTGSASWRRSFRRSFPGSRDRICRRRRARPAILPRRLRQDRRACRSSSRSGTRGGERRSSTTPTGAPAWCSTTARAPGSSASTT